MYFKANIVFSVFCVLIYLFMEQICDEGISKHAA
jgi:hypothetical protein